MKQKWSWLPLFFILPAALAVFKPAKTKNNRAETSFVLIELFTSEGCSSCPPADQLVEKIEEENKDKRVYVASYHVDYWDKLGWKDPFSKRDYSTRQYAYAKQFNLNSVYTPQIVVNGQSQFVGSNAVALRSAISSKLKNPESAHLQLNRQESPPEKISFHYTLEGADNSTNLQFVLLQKKAIVNIKAGENGGRTLTHTNVVRDVQSLPAGKFFGDFTLTIPADIRENWELLCYAKRGTTGEVLTAQRVGD